MKNWIITSEVKKRDSKWSQSLNNILEINCKKATWFQMCFYYESIPFPYRHVNGVEWWLQGQQSYPRTRFVRNIVQLKPLEMSKIEFFKRYNYNKKLLRHHSSLCIFSSIPLDMARYQNPMMSVVTWWKIISYGKLQIFPWNPQQWRHHDRHETSRGWANEYLQGNVGKRVAMLMEIFIGSIQHCVSEGTVNYRTWFGEGCK